MESRLDESTLQELSDKFGQQAVHFTLQLINFIEQQLQYTIIYAPISGEIVAVNEALTDSPEQVNSEPYEGGWLFKIKASD
ncbi:glycine cleavage system protein H, partial [Pantoea agglomerans]|uniref:glycine cleavage system protein H n=1 Tax=Enterobacter agglomerans TaxID=549 RepID=UPI0034E0C74F